MLGQNKILMKIDSQFPSLWRSYVLQSLYASLAVFYITLVLGMEHAAMIAIIKLVVLLALISHFAKQFIQDLV